MTDMAATWQRIEDWLGENAPEIAKSLRPGASNEKIRATERTLGLSFPDDFCDSYRCHDGQETNAFGVTVCGGFVEGGDFLSLTSITDHWQGWKGVLDAGTFEGIQSYPGPGVRSDWWNPRWIPITHDGGGNHFCLDLDPAPGGKMGQIITMWHDEGERVVVADSFRDWLTRLADEYEAGEWVYSEEDGGVVPWGDVND
ncbi:MAG: SMI1/KNR4 family protein [Janthinobacterium lividum]